MLLLLLLKSDRGIRSDMPTRPLAGELSSPAAKAPVAEGEGERPWVLGPPPPLGKLEGPISGGEWIRLYPKRKFAKNGVFLSGLGQHGCRHVDIGDQKMEVENDSRDPVLKDGVLEPDETSDLLLLQEPAGTIPWCSHLRGVAGFFYRDGALRRQAISTENVKRGSGRLAGPPLLAAQRRPHSGRQNAHRIDRVGEGRSDI